MAIGIAALLGSHVWPRDFLVPVGVLALAIMAADLITQALPRAQAAAQAARRAPLGSLMAPALSISARAAGRLAFEMAVVGGFVWSVVQLGGARPASFDDKGALFFAVLFLWAFVRTLTRGRALILAFRPFVTGAYPTFVGSRLAAAAHPYGRVVMLADTQIEPRRHIPMLSLSLVAILLAEMVTLVLHLALRGSGGAILLAMFLALAVMAVIVVRRLALASFQIEVKSAAEARAAIARLEALSGRFWLRPLLGNPVAVRATNESWMAAVDALLDRVDVVVVDATRPSGPIRWELTRALEVLSPGRLIIVVDRADMMGRRTTKLCRSRREPGANIVEYGARGFLLSLRLRLMLEQALRSARQGGAGDHDRAG